MPNSNFLQPFRQAAFELIKQGRVKEIIFSEHTYEVEVEDPHEANAIYWPFLQINDDGFIRDFFCTCRQSEENQSCIHLAAAFFRICHRDHQPLHVQFRHCLWNNLCQIASNKLGYKTKTLHTEKKGNYELFSSDKRLLFSLKAKTEKSIVYAIQILTKRVKETEETSLKFSNLSLEEMEQFKAGKGPKHLLYELSFWSDIAKWLFLLQDAEMPYKVVFDVPQENELPIGVSVLFESVEVYFTIAVEDWPELIDSLRTVHCSLKIYDYEELCIEAIEYDEEKKGFWIRKKQPSVFAKNEVTVSFSKWDYVKNKGFFATDKGSFFSSNFLPEHQVSQALSSARPVFYQFLKNVSIHEAPIELQNRITFIEKENALKISSYLFDFGDLKQKAAADFGCWIYLPKKGFFRLSNQYFSAREQYISYAKVSDFIREHRSWLNQYEGFQTHVGSIKTFLSYSMKNRQLCFDAQLDAPVDVGRVVDFGTWVYLPKRGFYLKKATKTLLPFQPGLSVPFDKISKFIDRHREDLEQVHSFFTEENPIESIGLEVGLQENQRLIIRPKIILQEGYSLENLIFFSHYLYIVDKGFLLLPANLRLPDKYRNELTIPLAEESFFLQYEIEKIRKFIVAIDRRLVIPTQLSIEIKSLSKEKKSSGNYFLLDLVYSSEIGQVSACDIWHALFEKKIYLFSAAGLIDLSEPRFNWLVYLKKQRLHRTKKLLRLNMLEWIRLCVFEEIKEPTGHTKEERKIKKLLLELHAFDLGKEQIDISSLHATLRPYQEMGLHWLWFLYHHQLSGLLCDEMGLGKTHQAMALIAAMYEQDEEKRNKYLVVCPTSVIYHWEELFKQFFPQLRICVFHGFSRRLELFSSHYDLILTSS